MALSQPATYVDEFWPPAWPKTTTPSSSARCLSQPHRAHVKRTHKMASMTISASAVRPTAITARRGCVNHPLSRDARARRVDSAIHLATHAAPPATLHPVASVRAPPFGVRQPPKLTPPLPHLRVSPGSREGVPSISSPRARWSRKRHLPRVSSPRLALWRT